MHHYSHLGLCHIFPGAHVAAYSWTRTSTFAIGKDVLWTIQESYKSKTLVWLLQHGKVGRAEGCRARVWDLKSERVGEMKRLVSVTNWSETREREESPTTDFSSLLTLQMFSLLNCLHFFIASDSSEVKETCQGTNFMSAKWHEFWSASDALLSNGHQWTLIYDFLVNTVVDSNETGTRYLPGNMRYFSQILFLELMEELCQCFMKQQHVAFSSKKNEVGYK